MSIKHRPGWKHALRALWIYCGKGADTLNTLKISFPHMGDYHVPISRFLKALFPHAEVIPPPPITQKTIELGSRISPDFICSPFKYNMGNFVEALDFGANVLIQTGLGCRFGYYGAVQEQILRDLGYHFEFICLSRNKASIKAIFSQCRRLNPDITWRSFFHALLMALGQIWIMDKLDYYLREHIGFEKSPGSFEREKKNMLDELMNCNMLRQLRPVYRKYKGIYQNIAVNIPPNVLRVGIVGELYTLMEPFSNHYLEKQLAKYGVAVSRKMSVTFLFFGKHDRISLLNSGGYLRYTVGANGVDSVAQCVQYARKGYDGILHIKSFGCTPELNAQPALIRISRDLNIPILHLSFDSQTSATGVQTRIEAFADMIKMKKDRSHEKSSQPRGRRGLHFHQGHFYQ